MDTRLLFIDREFVEKSKHFSMETIKNMTKIVISLAIKHSDLNSYLNQEVLKKMDGG